MASALAKFGSGVFRIYSKAKSWMVVHVYLDPGFSSSWREMDLLTDIAVLLSSIFQSFYSFPIASAIDNQLNSSKKKLIGTQGRAPQGHHVSQIDNFKWHDGKLWTQKTLLNQMQNLHINAQHWANVTQITTSSRFLAAFFCDFSNLG